MRLKVLLLSLLAVLAAGSAMSTTASAASKGPFWHVNNAKLALGVQEAFTAKGHLVLDGILLKEKVEIECQLKGTGSIDNNQAQGKAQTLTEFVECILVKPQIAGCVVTVTSPETRSELAYKGKEGEAGQKMVLLFAPKKGNIFSEINLVEKCGVLNKKGNKVETNAAQGWGTAALLSPEGSEALAGELIWQKPNITEAHHQGVNVSVGLKFANEPAQLQSKLVKVTLNSGHTFGAFEE